MARIRYLKPDFFKDEDIKDLPFEARLFYQGLWCYADKEGRLEDRPDRLRVEITPYDNVDPEKMLSLLAKPKHSTGKSFILRYEANNEKYIQILSWNKHQKPHHTERESVIPPPTNTPLTVKQPLDNRALMGKESSIAVKQCSVVGMEKGMGKIKSRKALKIGQPKKPTDPRIKEIIDAYHDKFAIAFGNNPVLNGPMAGAMTKKMLNVASKEVIIITLDAYFTSTDKMIMESGYNFEWFFKRFNALRIAASSGLTGTAGAFARVARKYEKKGE